MRTLTRAESRRSQRRRPSLLATKRFVLVASKFHHDLTRELVRGATAALRQAGVSSRQIRTVWVPGAFELPAAAARIARQRPQPDAIIAMGVIIKGQTPQYAALAHAVVDGLSVLSVTAAIPVTCGVIVAESFAQAVARVGGAMGHRGAEAAAAALEMVRLFGSTEPQKR
jgi:6,7-dimethyl-8-ribityllumazine synthase